MTFADFSTTLPAKPVPVRVCFSADVFHCLWRDDGCSASDEAGIVAENVLFLSDVVADRIEAGGRIEDCVTITAQDIEP